MSTHDQSEIYEQQNNTEDTFEGQVTAKRGEASELNSDTESRKKPAMKFTHAEEMDSLNHLSQAVISKENQHQNCDTNHKPEEEAVTNDNDINGDENSEPVIVDSNDTDLVDTNNSNCVDTQSYPANVPPADVFMSPVSHQCNHMNAVPMAAQADGQMYSSAASPSGGIAHNQPMTQGTTAMSLPQMGAFGPNGGSAGPCRPHGSHTHPAVVSPHHFNPTNTPPQSGTSTPNTVPMNNGNQGSGQQQHVVHVHINAGERFTVHVDDQIQQIEGKTCF